MNPWLLAFAVGAAGAAGSVARVWLDSVVTGLRAPRSTGPGPVAVAWPWGTLAVNCLGSLVMGAAVGLASGAGLPAGTEAVVGAGFCGGLTTFSTFSLSTVLLWSDGRRTEAGANVAANVLLGLASAGAGLWIGGLLAG